MPIDNISGVAWSSVSGVSGKNASDIASLSDIAAPVAGGADISFDDITVSKGKQDVGPSTAFNVTLPTTAGVGDWVLAMFTIDDPIASGITQNPTGWTLINTTTWGNNTSDAHIKLWYKELDGSEGSTFPVYATILTTRGIVAWTTIVSNIDTTNPISAVGTPAISDTTNAQSATITAPSVSVPDDGTFICLNAFDGGDGEPFAYVNSSFTFTDGGEDESGAGSTGEVSSAWKYATITGGSQTNTTLITAQVSNGKVAGHFALKKA